MNRSEIKGTIRAAYAALLRARHALLEGVEDQDCMLTPSDMDDMRRTLRDAALVLTEVKKITGKFGEIAEVRKLLMV